MVGELQKKSGYSGWSTPFTGLLLFRKVSFPEERGQSMAHLLDSIHRLFFLFLSSSQAASSPPEFSVPRSKWGKGKNREGRRLET